MVGLTMKYRHVLSSKYKTIPFVIYTIISLGLFTISGFQFALAAPQSKR